LPRSLATTLALFLLAGTAASLLADEVDMGTGYQLQNVEIMDPNMRLNDARWMMKELGEDVGLDCRDCHDLKDFAADTKPLKLISREMMRMEKDINDTYFAGARVVTCYTCHQGGRKPPPRVLNGQEAPYAANPAEDEE